ncbi:RNA 3'-terminal phosphate cyclase [Candidatus Bathyarchaeota archaeon]|nr:RNA 3'-terminal phosphate cyclase [Candidatus Bathyarchaeota archaeon]
MLEVDGGAKSGSGTILRLSVALAAILNQPLHIYNIRKKRGKPGLRPQHLEAVLTAAKLCSAEVKGAKVGSTEVWFYPKRVSGGFYQADIGTAGSIPMLMMTVLPICAFAENPVELRVTRGGTDVSHSPTINYIRNVLLPTLDAMGLSAQIRVVKYGYYPKGMGEVHLKVNPPRKLKPLWLTEFGELEKIEGISVCTFLEDRKVAERQRNAALKTLKSRGYDAEIQVLNDRSNPLQKGSSITLWAKTSEDCLIGADAIGELRKRSEDVGREAAAKLIEELEAKPTVDVHLADMLVPYVAFAHGNSAYLVRTVTDHLETNVWLIEELTGVKFKLNKAGKLTRVECEGMG